MKLGDVLDPALAETGARMPVAGTSAADVAYGTGSARLDSAVYLWQADYTCMSTCYGSACVHRGPSTTQSARGNSLTAVAPSVTYVFRWWPRCAANVLCEPCILCGAREILSEELLRTATFVRTAAVRRGIDLTVQLRLSVSQSRCLMRRPRFYIVGRPAPRPGSPFSNRRSRVPQAARRRVISTVF